jgi:DNA repair exonuclease SbcCD ATPase subunit
MMKKYVAMSVVAANLIALAAFAQEEGLVGAREAIRDARKDARTNIEVLRKEAQEAAQKTRQEVGSQIKDLRGETKQALEAKRAELAGLAKEKREDFRESVKVKREETKKKIEDERARLKEKLAKIKDERKKQIVEKVAQQIKELNERLTNHFTDVLEKLRKILARIDERINKAGERGLDVSTVKKAAELTNAEIKKAEEAIKAQAAKVYSVNVTTEEKLKVEVGAAREAFNKDIRGLRDIVQAARNAVHNVATALAKLPKGEREKNKVATSTATTTQP